jgi:L-fuculokinase
MEAVLIIDCGATNVRVSAVNPKGSIIATYNEKNSTIPGQEHPDYHVWDLDEKWGKISNCVKKLMKSHPELHPLAISVTTFGVDGAPFDSTGKAIYPIISWKCPRTTAIMEKCRPQLERIYTKSGVGEFSFNTLYKLVWIKENRPDIFDKMDSFVFISSMINHRLTGQLTSDKTMEGTSMLTDLLTRELSPEICDWVNLKGLKFPKSIEAGEVVGTLLPEVAKHLGLKAGLPVISAGHDTQFALYASGAEIGEPILSSGTWEILMVRSKEVQLSANMLNKGITTELDAVSGLYNPGVQWLSSGFLEWLTRIIYSDLLQDPQRYDKMIAEAQNEPVGSRGVRINHSFLVKGEDQNLGHITGMSINTQRATMYRAALEYLALQLKDGLQTLEKIGGFKTESLICVGGGSRNSLLNQIRADLIGCPIKVVQEAETTVLGAAMFAFAGVGYFSSVEKARQAMKPQSVLVLPSKDQSKYKEIFNL